jgi:hypothetical protein
MIVQVWELTCKNRFQKEGRVNKKIKTRLKRKFAKGKVEHVKEGSTLDIQVETIDQIYNQRFQNIWIIIGSKNPWFECYIKEVQES